MIEIHQKCSKPHVESIAAKEKTKKKNFRIFQVHDCNIQIMVLLFSILIDDGGGGGVPGLIEGRARTQSPTLTNYAPEFPTLGEIAGFNYP